MSVSNPNTIDMVTMEVDEAAGGISLALIITEYQQWSQEPHLRDGLKRKLETYYRFARSEDYKSKFGNLKPKVVLSTVYEPTPEILGLLARFTEATGIETRCDYSPERVAEHEKAMAQVDAILQGQQAGKPQAAKEDKGEGWLARLRRLFSRYRKAEK